MFGILYDHKFINEQNKKIIQDPKNANEEYILLMNPNYIPKKVYSESSESEKEDDSESELLNVDKL